MWIFVGLFEARAECFFFLFYDLFSCVVAGAAVFSYVVGCRVFDALLVEFVLFANEAAVFGCQPCVSMAWGAFMFYDYVLNCFLDIVKFLGSGVLFVNVVCDLLFNFC